jgi:hypothetical protein
MRFTSHEIERYRVTVRHRDVELRGYVDGLKSVIALAEALQPLEILVIASPAPDTYNPFETDEWRHTDARPVGVAVEEEGD